MGNVIRWTTRCCGVQIVGTRAEHCTECHETFANSKSGDAHRTGPFSLPSARRCLSIPEMHRDGKWAPRRTSQGYWTVNPKLEGDVIYLFGEPA